MVSLFVGLILTTAPALSQSPAPLPDAPAPAQLRAALVPPSSASFAAQPPSPAPHAAPDSPRYQPTPHHPWRAWVNSGQPIHPLSDGQKLRFWLHLETQPVSFVPYFVGASFEQGIDGDPKFGTDSGAYGERLGAAAIRDASMRFFVSSFFPVVLHQDPRYYRLARKRIVPRGLSAGEQALVTHTDSGRVVPNYSDILGHLAACALILTYYPAPSANGRVVVEAWATSIAGDAGNNLFLEFWPSIVSRWQRRRARIRAQRSSQTPASSSIP